MSRIDEVRALMVKAMKDGDKERKDALSLLLSALKNKAIDKRAETEENEVVLKEIKQVKETLELTPEDRTDIIEQCNLRISVYEEFAPKMMDEEEITAVIKECIAELGLESPTMKEKGKIMKILMPRVKGKADGSLVNQVISKILQ